MAKTKQVKMTPEIRAKLLGISVVSDTIDYVMDVDVPDEFKPVFKIKALTVEDSKVFRETSESNEDEAFEEMVRTHIVGWKNLLDDSTGEMFEFVADENGVCDKDTYFKLSFGLRLSILQFIYRMVGVA